MPGGQRPSVGLLGPLELWSEGRLVDVGGPRPRAALAALAARVGHPVSEGELIDAVWGDEPPASVRNGLQTHISNLRRFLGLAAAIKRVGDGYRLDAEAVDVDVVAFEDFLATARDRSAEGDADAAARAYDGALALWRGDPLPELADSPGYRPVIVRLEELRATAQEERIEALLAAGLHGAAAAELESLVVQEPLRERRRELQVLALYRCGQQAAALRAVQAARTTLAEELGLEPGPELRRLESLVLAQDPSLDWRPPTARTVISDDWAIDESTVASTGQLLGRRRELERCRGALRRLMDPIRPAGGVMLVGGEPGIGKTSLVEEVAATARAAGLAVWWGRCSDIEGAPPLWPWIQVLRDLDLQLGASGDGPDRASSAAELAAVLPELTPGAGDDVGGDAFSARFRLFDAVESALVGAARAHGAVLVLDDLHWADAASLRLLSFLAPRTRDVSLLVIGTYRTEAAAASSPLAVAIADLGPHVVDHHLLGGFDAEEIRRFAEDRLDIELTPELSEQLCAHTAGNPYFVAEMLRLVGGHGADGALGQWQIPVTVREVLRRRITALGADAAPVLEAAAVLGGEAALDVLAAMVEQEPSAVLDAVGPACAAGIVEVAGPGGLRFAHALVREVIYDELPPARRARLHADAGRALLRVRAGALPRHRAEVAHHLYRGAAAGTAVDAVDQLELAAQEASRARGYEDEVTLRQRAVEMAELAGVSAERHYVLLTDLSAALDKVGDATEARTVARDAVEVAERLHAPHRMVATLTTVTHANLWYRQPYGSVDSDHAELLRRLLDATPPDHRNDRARLLATLAESRYYDHDPATREMAVDAVAMAEGVGDAALLADVLFEALLAVWRPADLHLAAGFAQRLADMASVAALPPEVGIAARTTLRSLRIALGEDPGGVLEGDLTTAAALRLPFLHAQLLWHQAGAASARGDLTSAHHRNAEAASLIGRVTSYGVAATHFMEWSIAVERGDAAHAAAAIADRADAPQPATSRLVAMALAASDPVRARDVLAQAPAQLPEDWLWLTAACAEAELAVHGFLDPGDVLDRLEPHTGRVSMLGTMFHIGPVDLYLGRLRAVLGDLPSAEAALEEAVTVAERIGAPIWRARSELRLAEVLMRGGAPDERIDHLVRSAERTAAQHRCGGLAEMAAALRRL